ncbi:MAG: DNA (cytosine-5-)-methyltransferase [Proteobacteria bacterium]|nr:DNA (cytosine-5-)-methyltransferase [Pseudomonadota bacterium]
METVAFCEQDEHCQKVLRKHWPDVPIFDDVKNLKVETICHKKYLKYSDTQAIGADDISCLVGGFPCQDISVAGLQKGLSGERSGLWKEFKRLIQEIEPRYAIIENVANLRSKGLVQVIKDLGQIGYDSEWHIISARSIGAPHLRERIWIVAYPSEQRRQQEPGRSYENEREDAKKENNLSQCDGKGNSRGQISRELANDTNTNSEGLERFGGPERVQKKYTTTNSSHDQFSHSNNFRLWQPFTSEKEKSEWWTKATASLSHWKEAQSIICGVADGLPGELDRAKELGAEGKSLAKAIRTTKAEIERVRKERIKQLGNSVVPQIPELIGRAIVQHEESLK